MTGTGDDALVVKLGPLGDTLWVRSFGHPSQGERLLDVVETPSGALVACGLAASGLVTMAVAYSQNGDQLWYREFDPPNGTSQAAALLPTEDGGFFLLSRRSMPDRDLDFWLIRCTETGDSLWSTTLGTTTTDVPEALLWGEDGQLEIFGSSRNPVNLVYDLTHVTADQSGTEVNSDSWGDSTDWETLAGACRDSSSGEFILAGEASDGQPRHGYAIKLDGQGSTVWEQHFSAGYSSEKIAGVAPYLEGGALFAGWAGNSVTSPRLWLFTVGISGDTTWTWTGTQSGWGLRTWKSCLMAAFSPVAKPRSTVLFTD
ncbi:MAG: hypothetical protein IPG71_10295 [bacterium]|nr:hypothetical protein [bacterium]